jgi:hypothetical protein
LQHEKFQEAAHLIRKYPLTAKIRLHSILSGVECKEADCSLSEVASYFEGLVRRGDFEKLAFSIEELKN